MNPENERRHVYGPKILFRRVEAELKRRSVTQNMPAGSVSQLVVGLLTEWLKTEPRK